MKVPVQSSGIAVAGASLAILSTVMLTIFVEGKKAKIDQKSRDIDILEREFQRDYGNHLRSEQLVITANLLASFVSIRDPGVVSRFVIPRTAKYVVDAICIFRGSHERLERCGEEEVIPPESTTSESTTPERQSQEELMARVAELRMRFIAEDLDAFDHLIAVANSERIFASEEINAILRRIEEAEVERRKLRTRAASFRYLQVALNLLGLVLVLLKDVPIWSDSGVRNKGATS